MIHVVFAMLYMLIWALILASRRSNELVTNYSTYENCRRKKVTNNCARLRKRINCDTKIQGALHQVQQSCDSYDLNISIKETKRVINQSSENLRLN